MKNIKNSIYGAIDALILPIVMLVSTPVFLNYLGIEGYGMWVLINSVVASLSIFNFGGGDIVIKFLSSSGKNDNKNTSKEVFSTVFAFQSFVLSVIYLLFLIVAPVASQYASENLLTFVDILYIAIPIFFIKQSEQLLYAFLKGYEQFGYMVVISTISKILFFSTQIIIAIFTRSLEGVFFGALVMSALLFLLQVAYMKITHKNNISFSKASIKTARSLVGFGSWNWLSSLVSIFGVHSDKWLVSILLGLKTFGFYSVGVLVFNQLHTVMSSSIAWVFPDVSKGQADKESLVNKYWKLSLYIGIASLLISIILTNLSFIFELWVGEEFYKDSQYYINTFLLLFPIFTMTIVPYFYLLGLGLVKYKFFVNITSLLVKIITIWLVIDVFNIKEWVLFFVVYIAVEYIAYSIVISRNLSIKFIHLIAFLLFQIIILMIRVY